MFYLYSIDYFYLGRVNRLGSENLGRVLGNIII